MRKMTEEKPLVSILCVTYNHEAYIKDAIMGFLCQITDFPFEVIIADDCSTDNNQNIIKKFASENPTIIKPIFRTENVGVGLNYCDALEHVNGDFVAVCDGDDYWTDENKLQKQVDFLREHPDFSMCCHPFNEHYEDGSKEDAMLSPWDIAPPKSRERGFLVFDDLISISPVGSMTAMYRWSLVQSPPLWMNKYITADFIMNLLHADKGKVGIIEDVMAVYRKHNNGIWINHERNEHRELMQIQNRELFLDLDYELGQRHQETLQVQKGPKVKILFLAIENSIHAYKWIKAVAENSRFEVQVYSTFRIDQAPELKYDNLNIKLHMFNNQPSLEEVIKTFRPDIIHTLHTQFSAYPVLDLVNKSGDKSDFPVWINSIWGSDLFFWKNIPTQKKKLQDLMKRVDYIVGEGRRDEKHALELGFYGKFLGPIPASAGIDFSKIMKIPYFSPSKRKEIMVKGYDLGVGRFRDAIIALVRLKNKVKDYRINIFSLDMDRNMLEVYAQESGLNIRVLQHVDNDEMLDLFSKSRISIACSYTDGVPGTLLEAMSCGAFPIQTNTAITEGWVSQNKSALLVPPDNVDKLVAAIELALNDDELVDEAAKINRETIKNKADFSVSKKKIESIYNQVITDTYPRILRLRKKYEAFSSGQIPATHRIQPVLFSRKKPSLFNRIKRLFSFFPDARLIRNSGYFDPVWYIDNYPNMKSAILKPLSHYILKGAYQGYNPGQFFDSEWYLLTNPDVYQSGINPLAHYLRFGESEGRQPTNSRDNNGY